MNIYDQNNLLLRVGDIIQYEYDKGVFGIYLVVDITEQYGDYLVGTVNIEELSNYGKFYCHKDDPILHGLTKLTK